jgi:hypothetical protein
VRPGGRTGVGARNHCAHGKGVSMETILDWRPFDYATIETKDDDMLMLRTVQLEPLPDGRSTRMHCHIKVQMPGPAWLRRAVVKFMMTKIFKFDQMLVGAARMLAEDQRSQMMPQPLAGAASN